MLKFKRAWVLITLLLIVPLMSTHAQEEDGRSVILAALANLHTHDFQMSIESLNHVRHYEGEAELYQTLTEYIDETRYAVSGDVSLQRQLRSTTIIEGTEESGTLLIERILVDEADYALISILDGEETLDIEFPSVWMEYQSLIDNIEGEQIRLALANALEVDTNLQELDWHGELIIEVTELPSETINEIEMRVFDVQVDEIELMYRLQMSALGLEDDADAPRPDVPDDFVLESQRRFWVGADDQLLYRMELTGFTSIPIPTTMRIDTVVESVFEFSHYDEIEPIVAPELN